jgi:hypothetical protein
MPCPPYTAYRASLQRAHLEIAAALHCNWLDSSAHTRRRGLTANTPDEALRRGNASLIMAIESDSLALLGLVYFMSRI